MKYGYEVLKDKIYRFSVKLIKEYKYYLIIFSIFFLLAFVTGIFTALKYSMDLSVDNFINKALLEFLKHEKGFWGLFFSYYIWLLLICVFVIFFTKNVLCNIMEILAFMLFSYIIGFDLIVMFFSFGIVGIIFAVCIYGLLMLMICLTVILLLSIATKNMKNKCTDVRACSEISKLYLLLCVAQGVFLLLFCILLSILHIFVIIE